MTRPRPDAPQSSVSIPPLPGWITAGPQQTLAQAAFRSGAALAHLHLVLGQAAVPQALWRDRLALAAAENCVRITGRREGASALRDALHLTRPGDHPGPAGAILRQWSRAVARPVSGLHQGAEIDDLPADRIAACLEVATGNPVDRAAQILESLLAENPRAETPALILADAVLAGSLGWHHLLPVLSLALKPRDLRQRGDDLALSCHRAIVAGAGQAVPLAADLVRRAARMRIVVPKLRAKGAGRAVDLFLSRDALAPSALAAFMSDRATRRFCDRLVDLGAVRELTGRDTFRLYGL
ncbi:MAG: DUF1403 family protein [Pseudorhodobacter sp.]